MSPKADFPHHAGGVLQVKHTTRWGAVPEALLEDSRLSLSTRAVGAWLAIKPSEWVVVVRVLQKKLEIGKDAWQKCARELEQAGYFTRYRVNGPDGRWIWHITFNPVSEATPTIAGFSGDGFTGDGSSTAGEAGHKVIPAKDNHLTNTTTTASPPLLAAGSGSDLIFEKSVLHLAERLPGWLAGIDLGVAQSIVDELAGALEAAKAGKRLNIASPRDWTKRLVLAAKRGEFEPDLALAVQARRHRVEQQLSTQQEIERGHAERVGARRTQAGADAIAQLKQNVGIREKK